MQNNMNTEQRLAYLLNKYRKGICSKTEAEEILDFLENRSFDEQLKREALKHIDKYSEVTGNKENLEKILDKLHNRINVIRPEKKRSLIGSSVMQFMLRAAAVLIIPLLAYSAFLTYRMINERTVRDASVVVHTLRVPAGVRTDFILPDGSKVWLNSGSVFKYPASFQSGVRLVELTGEGYFDIIKDTKHPFLVKTGNLNVEVKGTKFDVINYPGDPQIEVILESGQVNLFSGDSKHYNQIALLEPGERATYQPSGNITSVRKVDVEKYTSWKNGVLIFRDDPMTEVIRKLGHRFNVDFELENPELKEYIYTATFINESLPQILELLKNSAPIKYSVIDQVRQADASYSKCRIILTKLK
jgi:ferric-dicitrate binding protein FerR (iron transport regulator)